MRQLILDKILSIVCSVLDAYSAVLVTSGGILIPEGQYAVTAGFSLGNNLDYSATITEGQGLVGWILRTKEPLLATNFDQHNNYLAYYKNGEEQSIKAFMGCALMNGEGAICVDSKRQYSFSEKEQKMLYLFAALISQILQELDQDEQSNTIVKYYAALRTVYELRHQYSRWSDFIQHLLGLVSAVTGFSYCVLCTRDAQGENYVVEEESSPLLLKNHQGPLFFPMTHGIVGWVFRNGKPVISDSAEGVTDTPLVGGGGLSLPPFQTVAAFPLIIQKKTLGVLCVAHDAPFPIQDSTKDFIRMTAEHLALFLENLYVKSRLREMHHVMRQQ